VHANTVEITKCRICGNNALDEIIDLGNQCLTGVFPRSRSQKVEKSPLRLVKCSESARGACGLLQLRHSHDPKGMFGNNYGYRSGLNPEMVSHLHRKVDSLLELVDLQRGDLVVDIGSNDGTLLSGYPKPLGLRLVGVDPAGRKFLKYYPPDSELISEFFTSETVGKFVGNQHAKVITSIAMFYDLESPFSFMQNIYDTLADDGIWHFEQSYMPSMLANNSYDTICHEHLEYYGLKQIKWLTDRANFKIIGVKSNGVNGGSFAVTVAKKNSRYGECSTEISEMLSTEKVQGLSEASPYLKFAKQVHNHKRELRNFVKTSRLQHKRVFGLGASTKGNVILQYCGFSEEDIEFIGDVNPEKFGCYTPGTGIPIISEQEAVKRQPNFFLILPWHFRSYFMSNRAKYGDSALVFPLPNLTVA
jgi:NDP-4-keto-2,6-dideoxyhexose 3-C-methyltransferase